MNKINSMKEFKRALEELSLDQQRVVAAHFVANVFDLTDDDRIKQAQKIAARPNASPEELTSAYHAANHATVESSIHQSCQLVDWHKQAAHFVAKACAENLAPAHPGMTWRCLAWNVADYCRAARICASIEHGDGEPSLSEAEQALNKQTRAQYEILDEYLQGK